MAGKRYRRTFHSPLIILWNNLASENLTTLQIGRKDEALKIACWNVRTMYEAGKLENVKSEMS